jgi:hypothetical protein
MIQLHRKDFEPAEWLDWLEKVAEMRRYEMRRFR